MIEPLQAVLIRMLLNEIKKYVFHSHTRWATRNYFLNMAFYGRRHLSVVIPHMFNVRWDERAYRGPDKPQKQVQIKNNM